MKKFFLSALALTLIVITGMTFAKSRSKSHKSSGKQTTTQKQKTADKPVANTTGDKQNNHKKNTKSHRCKLADGKVDHSKTQQECLQMGGSWAKY